MDSSGTPLASVNALHSTGPCPACVSASDMWYGPVVCIMVFAMARGRSYTRTRTRTRARFAS